MAVRGSWPAAVQARRPAVPASRSSAGIGVRHLPIRHRWSAGLARKLLLSEICTLAKLMLVMPATNVVSERSFSALKRVKTYLRSTTGEGRLNHLMLLQVHKELADGIDMLEVANLLAGDNQRRKQMFGKFSKNDLPMKSTFVSTEGNSDSLITTNLLWWLWKVKHLLVQFKIQR